MERLVTTLWDFIKDNRAFSISVTLAALLSFTPFYGIAYIIALYWAKNYTHFLSSFSSIVGRTIISTLLMMVSIMITGLLCWGLGATLLHILVLIFFGLMVAALHSKSRIEKSSTELINKGDLVSIAIALFAPIIIFTSFQLPNPSHYASYQFASSAWDHGSHIIMLQSTGLENGYVYGHIEDVKDKIVMKDFSSYPQGWHLVSTNMMNGFGINFFSPDRQLLSLNAYIALTMAWYILAAFCVSRVSWHLLQRTKITKLPDISVLPVFITSSIFLQSITFWRALDGGSTNYFGIYAFLAIMTAAIVESGYRNKNSSTLFMLASISGVSAALIWILPLPAVSLAILLTYLSIYRPTSIKNLLLSLWSNRLAIGVVALAFGAMLAQTLIFLVYSDVGEDQLNVGRSLRHETNQTLLLLTSLFTFGVWATIQRLKGAESEVRGLYYVVSPFLILTAGIYTYQLSSSFELSYYYGKIATLTYLVVGLFFVPAISYTILQLCQKLDKHLAPIVCLAVLGLVFVGTNQQMGNIHNLFQRYSAISPEIAKAVITYATDYNPKEVRPVVFRNESVAEDRGGNLHAKMAHAQLGCENIIINPENMDSLEDKITALDECAETLSKSSKKLFVITSNKTIDHVRSLNRDNIIISNVP